MFTKTDTSVVMLSQEAEDVIALGRKHHWRFKVLTEFQGVIDRPVFNSKGDWIYIPKREEDESIIPKAAYRRHAVIERAGYKVAQVVIGHEVKVAPERPVAPPKPKKEIDWENVAEVVAGGFLVCMTGFATISFYALGALAGTLMLVDPSYCIVLDDGAGTVIELISWNAEA